jgi:hypothetical protein
MTNVQLEKVNRNKLRVGKVGLPPLTLSAIQSAGASHPSQPRDYLT